MMVPPELVNDAFQAVQRELDKANAEIIMLQGELEDLREGLLDILTRIDLAATEGLQLVLDIDPGDHDE